MGVKSRTCKIGAKVFVLTNDKGSEDLQFGKVISAQDGLWRVEL